MTADRPASPNASLPQAAPPRVLFITRRFPPSVGGLETFSKDVWDALTANNPGSQLVAFSGHNRWLPLFLARAWWKTTRAVLGRRCDVVMATDATVYVAMWPLLALLRVPRVALVMGLDLTWNRPSYRVVARAAVPRATRVVAISEPTAAIARSIGVPPGRIGIAQPAADPPAVTPADRAEGRRRIHERLSLPDDAAILVTLGRLVARKGVRWFVGEVMPKLPASVHYVVAGSGAERVHIEAAIDAAGLRDRVHLLGRVADDEREDLLRGADLFVQPNIRVPGDMEGFGLVVIEAAGRGTPVAASALEGLAEAVVDGETGVLVEPGDAHAWCETVTDLLADRDRLEALGQRFRAGVIEHNGSTAFREALARELAQCARDTRSQRAARAATVRSIRRS